MSHQFAWKDRSPCWQCRHFVALTEGGSAFCVQGGHVQARSQPEGGCAFHSALPEAPAHAPKPVTFLQAWRRAPAAIPRPPEVLAMMAAERTAGVAQSEPGSGWRSGEEHQWSRDPGRGRRYR